ncbi:MAG: pseudouridine synthase [Paludibacter sp.]|nr:pseudouridine synthase [Paludibacter sp.]
MTNNENWQGSPRRSGAGAGRDGKPYEKRDVKSILKGTRGGAKYTPNQSRDNDYPSFKPNFEKREENRNSYEKRSFENRDNSFQREGRPYERSGNRPYSSDRGGNRPYSSDRNENRPYSSERNDNRPYSSERSEGGRPRFKPTGGRPRFSVKKEGDASTQGNYIETRFDNQDNNRRPRIRTSDYNPNAKYSKKKQLEYRRNEIDYTKPVRLNKFLANAGICSRREADEFIKAGVITVNGETVTEMGVKVMHSDKVMFHNQLVRSERKVYLLLNKPKDTVTTAEDTHERRTVLDLVKNACSERIYPVGRLDRNTTGVLLLTNDGDLASRLTHPKYDKKKIYHVTLDKPLEIPDFESVLAGVMLDEEKIAADALNFIKDDDFRQIGIEIHSGQNRVVRRIFEKLGYKVVRLDRVFFAGLTKKNLPRGKYRFLTEREVNMLKMGAYE